MTSNVVPFIAMEGQRLSPHEPEPRPQWPGLPLYPGDWREVPDLIRARLGSLIDRFAAESRLPKLGAEFLRMRSLRLPFYPGSLLIEGLAQPVGARFGVARLLLAPDGLAVLNGTSAVVHEINARHFRLTANLNEAGQYLRFFCSCAHGGEGRFRIVESMGEVEPGFVRAEHLRTVSEAVQPIEALNDAHSLYATLFYGDAVFRAIFQIEKGGMVRMQDDDGVATGALCLREAFDGFWQMYPHEPIALTPNPTAESGS